MSRMIKHILATFFCLLLIGCANRVIITSDGLPIPTHAYVMSNPNTGIKVQLIAISWEHAYEGDERILWPKYMSKGEVIKVDAEKAAFVEFNVKIQNLNKAFYRLVERTSSKSLIDGLHKSCTVNGVYHGRLKHQSFRLRHKIIAGRLTKNTVELWDEWGKPIIIIGPFLHKSMVSPEIEERGDAG